MKMKNILLSIVLLFTGLCSTNADEISASPFRVAMNDDSVMVSVFLNNGVSHYYGICFDLTLPKGITLVNDADGTIFAVTNRTLDFKTREKQIDSVDVNSYRMLAYSPSKITAGTDSILTFVLKTEYGTADGTYRCNLTNIVLCDDNYTDTTLPDAYMDLTVVGEHLSDSTIILSDNDTVPPAARTKPIFYKVATSFSFTKFRPIVLPFSLTKEEVDENFGSTAVIGDISYWDYDVLNSSGWPDNISISVKTADTTNGLEANHVYLIKSAFTTDTIRTLRRKGIAENINRVTTSFPLLNSAYEADCGVFYGSYLPDTIPYRCLFVKDNSFFYSIGRSTMKGYRAYIYLPKVESSFFDSGAQAKVSFLWINEDETTNIGLTKELNKQNDVIKVYNLSGQYIGDGSSYPSSGIYIRNGKKIYIK